MRRCRTTSLTALLVVAAAMILAPSSAVGQTPVAAPTGTTLLLPLRSIGVSDTTVRVATSLLAANLRAQGWTIIFGSPAEAAASDPATLCDEPGCATRAMLERQAGRVVYGSMNRLGRKVLVRLSVLAAGSAAPSFTDELTAMTEEDLDTVMRRFAEAIAAGSPDAGRASVETVLAAEARRSRLRSSRSGVGFRSGFLFPTGKSYTGSDRMTHLQIVFKHEQPGFLIETTPLGGFTFGDGNLEWTILDVAVAKIFSRGDVAPFLGVGVGIHSTRLEKKVLRRYFDGQQTYEYEDTESESATAPIIDLVGGVLGFRTFDFELVFEARYRYLFEDFDRLGGKGAHGILLTIGTDL